MATPLTNLTFPTIHLNGTSRKELVDGYVKAHSAVNAALAAVAATYPNGRDYYPQGDRAIQLAMDQHSARLEHLKQVLAELDELAFAADQGGKS
jgi:hypothetical protein